MMLLYYLIRLINQFALRIFFSQIEAVGTEYVSKEGPLIIVGNHKNQFVDPMIVVSWVKRPVSFLIAEKSMHRRIIGDVARWMRALPVIRPQDRARGGSGKIVGFEPSASKLLGNGETKFTSDVAVGELILIKEFAATVAPMQVVAVLSDNELTVKAVLGSEERQDGHAGKPVPLPIAPPAEYAYKIVPKVDQTEVFGKVHDALCRGSVIGIFPEGGSSDRTDLLPLKAGVAVMALGAADRGARVKVLPFGINYSNGSQWRSKVLVDIGKPLEVSPEILEQYRRGEKREAYAKFLPLVEAALRNVTLNAPDMLTMRTLRTMRRMYQGDVKLPPKRFMELNRRFAKSFGKFKGDERFLALVSQVNDYMIEVENMGFRDPQIASLPGELGSLKVTLKALFVYVWNLFRILLFFLFMAPFALVWLPVFSHLNNVVNREMRKALAGSTVKVTGEDVAASQKIMGMMVWAPVTIIAWTAISAAVTAVLTVYLGGPGDLMWIWIVALVVFVGLFPLSVVVTLAGERAFVVLQENKRLALVIACVGQAEERSRGGKLRLKRRHLALKIQDFFDRIVIPTMTEWNEDPIIDRKTIVDHRRRSDHPRALVVEKEIDALVAAGSSVSPSSPSGSSRTLMKEASDSPMSTGSNRHHGQLIAPELRDSLRDIHVSDVGKIMQKTNLIAFNPLFRRGSEDGENAGTEGLDHRALSKKISSMNSVLHEGDNDDDEVNGGQREELRRHLPTYREDLQDEIQGARKPTT